MVLAPQELLVLVELKRDVDLVANGAEFRGLVKGLQESPLVKARLCLHEPVVDPLEKGVFAVGKRVMKRLFDRVVAVPLHAVEVGDGMASGACDAGVRGGIVDVVVVGIVELSAEEGDGV